MTARGSWKRTEAEVGKWLGGTRVPVTGRARGDAPDVAHPRFSIEVKHWSSMPVRVMDAFAQAKAAKRGEQVPIVVLHPAGGRHADDLTVLRLEDFAALVDGVRCIACDEPVKPGADVLCDRCGLLAAQEADE